jgi:hypothetical protein
MRYRMKQLITFTLAAIICAGCATSFDYPDNQLATSATSSKSGMRAPVRFQNLALNPRNGGQLIHADALLAGDILLSATDGITSAGIRLLTMAPVSHASVYIGNHEIVEAVGQGVRKRTIAETLQEEAVVVVFRHPRLEQTHAEKIRSFALQKVGKPYDHLGIVLQAPFSIERRLCELPLVPDVIRHACLQGIATIQLGTVNNDRFFCSQLVLESYRQAGLPLTQANPRWISPADILHMREGDVPSMRVRQTLAYVGHLKFRPQAVANSSQQHLSD